jgi:hypothetical protein
MQKVLISSTYGGFDIPLEILEQIGYSEEEYSFSWNVRTDDRVVNLIEEFIIFREANSDKHYKQIIIDFLELKGINFGDFYGYPLDDIIVVEIPLEAFWKGAIIYYENDGLERLEVDDDRMLLLELKKELLKLPLDVITPELKQKIDSIPDSYELPTLAA